MGQTQGGGGLGGQDRRVVIDRYDGLKRVRAGIIDDLGGTFVEISKIERDRSAVGVFFQDLTAVGSDGDLDAEAVRRLQEIGYTVRRRRDQQQETCHGVTSVSQGTP